MFKIATQGKIFRYFSQLIILRTESASIFLDTVSREEEGTSADILDNSYWTCFKFKFFCDVNQTITVASTVFVSKCKCQRERAGSFSPFRIYDSSGFGSSIGTISPLESQLAMFQCKEDKKNLRAKVKLTVLFKTKHLTLKHRNTQNGSKSTNHKSRTTTFCFLRGSLRWSKRRESEESAASSDFDWRRRKTQNPKTFLASQVGCYPQTAVKASII